MNVYKPCPFGEEEHFPRIETGEMDEPFPDGDKWGAMAICDEHAFNVMGFGKTEADALNDLERVWNTRNECPKQRLIKGEGDEFIIR